MGQGLLTLCIMQYSNPYVVFFSLLISLVVFEMDTGLWLTIAKGEYLNCSRCLKP